MMQIFMTSQGVVSSIILQNGSAFPFSQQKTSMGVLEKHFSAKPIPAHENGVRAK